MTLVANDKRITGVPHRLMADDEYRHFHIPEGAMVIPNIWYVYGMHLAMLHSLIILPFPGVCYGIRTGTPTQRLSDRNASKR